MRFVCVVSMSQKFRLHYNPLFNSWIAIKVKKRQQQKKKQFWQWGHKPHPPASQTLCLQGAANPKTKGKEKEILKLFISDNE